MSRLNQIKEQLGKVKRPIRDITFWWNRWGQHPDLSVNVQAIGFNDVHTLLNIIASSKSNIEYLLSEVERLRKFESRVFHAENQSNTAWRRVENYKKVIRDLKKVAKKALEGGEI